jgi:hypothetical protein
VLQREAGSIPFQLDGEIPEKLQNNKKMGSFIKEINFELCLPH